MKRVYFVLCVLFSILNINLSEENLPHRENDSSIFYYGFINNEKYQHYLPSKYNNIDFDTDLIKLSCHKGYIIEIKKASIVDLNEEENNYTHMAKELCFKKEQCQIDVKKFKRNTKNKQLDFNSKLAVEYICLSSQKNLYDGSSFHQGVTHKYLIVRDKSLACIQNDKDLKKFVSVSKALESCSLWNCKYVVWNDEEKKAIICNDNRSDNLITKNNDITYINPTVFYTYGYTTFLNYVAICDEVVKGIAYNLSMGKSVNTCKNLDCDFFTKSYAGSIKSLNNNKNGKTWYP
ncbi:conserved Plasmodium protein, unknown function [Plasmodium berghei]|uniref:SUEL-type lectin domain-containing protein n=1 Tax=Plasmodium berghei TaxID=5821 RepID=A0A1D3LX67_PLABE|nr:conserved Plasmodium protein, unknown function [Plasmodium berghei]